MNSLRRRGRLMAEYISYTWAGVEVKPRPCGWRNWLWQLRIVRSLWRQWPILSGSEPKFAVRVVPKDKRRKGETVKWRWAFHGPSGNTIDSGETTLTLGERGKDEFVFTAPVLGTPGQHRLDATLIMSVGGGPRRTWVNFNLLSTDSLILWLSALVGSAVITIGGGWLVGNIVKQDLPNPVIVVIATPTSSPTTIPTATPLPPTPETRITPTPPASQ